VISRHSPYRIFVAGGTDSLGRLQIDQLLQHHEPNSVAIKVRH
jgi:hypothetical protein